MDAPKDVSLLVRELGGGAKSALWLHLLLLLHWRMHILIVLASIDHSYEHLRRLQLLVRCLLLGVALLVLRAETPDMVDRGRLLKAVENVVALGKAAALRLMLSHGRAA